MGECPAILGLRERQRNKSVTRKIALPDRSRLNLVRTSVQGSVLPAASGTFSRGILRTGLDGLRFDSVILIETYGVFDVFANLYSRGLVHSGATRLLHPRK